jgi:ATP-dependent DNA helicase HFM1/MER3
MVEIISSRQSTAGFWFATKNRLILKAKYYLKFETVQQLVRLKEKASASDIWTTVCNAKEFETIRFSGDKAILNKMNKDIGIRFPIEGKVKEIGDKVSVLAQTMFANLTFPEKAPSCITYLF